MLETAHRTVPGFRIARIVSSGPVVVRLAEMANERERERENRESGPARRRNGALCVPIGGSGRALPPPFGVVAPHRIPRLAVVACLARYASSLAGVTFTPAQPPSVINSPCEKTNLTQKQPSRCELVKGLNV